MTRKKSKPERPKITVEFRQKLADMEGYPVKINWRNEDNWPEGWTYKGDGIFELDDFPADSPDNYTEGYRKGYLEGRGFDGDVYRKLWEKAKKELEEERQTNDTV